MKIAIPIVNSRSRRQGEELSPNDKDAVSRRRRRPINTKLLLLVTCLVLLAGAFLLWRQGQQASAAEQVVSVPVTKGNLDITVESSGKVAASRSASVKYEAQGQVREVLVKSGDKVEAGQPLVRLNDDEQRPAVQEAEAKLRSAQAELNDLLDGSSPAEIAGAEAEVQAALAALEKVMQGATPKEIGDAEAELRAAQAKLQTVRAGATPKEIADAGADLRAAQVALEAAKRGATAQEITEAEADLKAALANLEAVRAGATPKEIADAEADLRAAQATLDAAKASPSSGELTAAESELKSARLKLDALKAGPTQAEKSTAQLAATQAESNLSKVRADANLAKQSAEIALDKADRALREAQRIYGRVADELLNEKGELMVLGSDPRAEQYYEVLNKLKEAEVAYRQAQLDLEAARQKEVADVSEAEAKLADAKAQLQDLLDGPTPSELAAAQLEVDKAQQDLDKLRTGPDKEKVAEAEAGVTKAQSKLSDLKAGPSKEKLADAEAEAIKAQAKLDELRAGPDKEKVAEAEAEVVKAQTKLNELRAGPSRDKLAEAQAEVDKAQNKLNELRAGPSRADVAEAEAGVAQKRAELQKLKEPASSSDIAAAEEAVVSAQKSLDDARRDLEKSTLRAPFSGTVTSVTATLNSQTTAGDEAASIVDPNGMHLLLEVSESDVEKVKVGQEARITFDAMEGQTITGTVTSVSPVASSGQDVVTYRVEVQFDPRKLPVKVGMSATATILVERKEGAIQVPNRALQTAGPSKTLQVLYGDSETPVTVRVKTGATNGQMTEIVGCLDTGNQCLREGDKVSMPLPNASDTRRGEGGQIMFGPGDGAPNGDAAPIEVPLP